MATNGTDTTGGEARPCPPCRGTGKLISTSGGTPHEVTCPWCGGGGVWRPDIDAQAVDPKPDAASA